jgi:hypothetical protein
MNLFWAELNFNDLMNSFQADLSFKDAQTPFYVSRTLATRSDKSICRQ